MTVEILGTRLISPVFGAGLFVWSALLAVTLSALAIGYYAGGIFIDRWPRTKSLALTLMLAGLLLAAARVSLFWLLGACEGLGPRLGPLVCAALLFGPALTLLGAVSPMLVRLVTNELEGTGQRVGALYAISTLGSVAATLLAGFVLIPTFETTGILSATAGLLIATGALILARRGAPWALTVVVIAAFANKASPPELPPGIERLARAQGVLGLIEVFADKARGVRLMRADHSIIGAQFVRDGSPAFAFLHILEATRHFHAATPKDALQIGLGVGSVPVALERVGIRVDVVEIEPAVARFAKEHFAFAISGETHLEDARTYLQRTNRQYDLIIHDTFTGGTTPEHLLSLEFFERIKKRLRPGGVLALNFVGFTTGPHAEASHLVARTLRAAFKSVRAFRDAPPLESAETASNVIYFAADHELRYALPPDAQFENQRCERTQRAFPNWEDLRNVPAGNVVTDARNPLARLQMAVAEQHFHAMQEMLPREVWLQ